MIIALIYDDSTDCFTATVSMCVRHKGNTVINCLLAFIIIIIIIIIITLFAQRKQRNKNSELDCRAGQHGSKKATLIVAREEKIKYT